MKPQHKVPQGNMARRIRPYFALREGRESRPPHPRFQDKPCDAPDLESVWVENFGGSLIGLQHIADRREEAEQ